MYEAANSSIVKQRICWNKIRIGVGAAPEVAKHSGRQKQPSHRTEGGVRCWVFVVEMALVSFIRGTGVASYARTLRAGKYRCNREVTAFVLLLRREGVFLCQDESKNARWDD